MTRMRLLPVLLWLLASPVLLAQPPETQQWRVATREVPPFAMKSADGSWSGISIELLQRIVSQISADSGRRIELDLQELSLSEMLTAVERKEVDLAAAALTVSFEREQRMDFTHPFHSSGLGIAVANQSSGDWENAFSAIFSLTMLKVMGGLLAILVVTGIVMYFLERRRNPDQFGGNVTEGVGSGIWWAAVTTTTVGYGDKAPTTLAGRVVGFIWMFAGLFIVASFTATVTSAMTVGSLESKISGPEQLSRVRVGTVANSTSQSYLDARHINARTFAGVEQALAALSAGDLEAVVYDAPILRYLTHQQFSGVLRILPDKFQRQDYAFALPSVSPHREAINQALLRCITEAEWKALLAKYFGTASGD